MRNQQDSIEKGKIIHIEREYFKGGWLLSAKQKRTASIILLIGLIILLYFILDFYSTINLKNNWDRLYFVLSGLSWIVLYIGILILLSMKTNYLTVYENGINYPVTAYSSIFLPFFHCDNIMRISVNEAKKALIIKLKSGKEYSYNHFSTSHLYPLLKTTFNKYKHIEFVDK